MQEGSKIKHYELLSRIGEGGMGVVWRARDTRLGRTVALKMLPGEMGADEERAHRFEREARAASSITHPGIATLYDFDRDGDVAFLTMELVRGPTLRQLLEQGPLPIDALYECGTQVAEALAAAHQAGVIHRDLKPENIMSSSSGHYKVLDFGIARFADSGGPQAHGTQTPTRTWATKAGALIGTVAYMSPEQVLGQTVDARSDIFSFGSVLYELATGHSAFQRNNEIATGHAVAYEQPDPVRSRRGDAPHALELILQRCLAKDPEQRYASSAELADDLSALRSGTLSGKRTLSGLHAYAPPSRRRWWLGGLLALAVLAAGVLGWQALRVPAPDASAPMTSEPPGGRPEMSVKHEGKPRVIVAFFENNSGDAAVDWVSRGLPEMMTTDLSAFPGLEVIATQRLYDLLTAAGRDSRQALDRSTTAELARWAGADLVISGSVFKSGEQYRIDAQAYDTASGTVAVAHKVEGTELLGMVSALTSGLLDGLKVSAQEPGAPTVAMTGSEEAFQRFVDGKGDYERLDYEAATVAFERAVVLDPEFALARLHWAMGLLQRDQRAAAVPLIEQVLQQLGELPAPEQRLAQALGAFYVDGDFEAGSVALESLVEEYPQNKQVYVWWARAHRELEGSHMHAVRKLRLALSQDPNNLPAVVGLAGEMARFGAVEDARLLLDAAAERNPDAEMLEQFAGALDQPPEQ